MRAKRIVCFVFFSLAILPASLFAQMGEIHPYAGGFWPSNNALMGKFASEGIYGLKGGGYLTDRLLLGGNLGYINHFRPDNDNNITRNNELLGINNPSTRAWLYDINLDYNFFMGKAAPYVAIGVGGLTATVKDGETAVYAGGTTVKGDEVTVRPTLTLDDGDTFFTFSYGGGIKALSLWGPVGLRGDLRGRTIPNFYGRSTSWPELTGGLTFSWGER